MAEQSLQLVELMAPCSVDDLNEALQDAGLTSITWSLIALREVARLSGRELNVLDSDGFVAAPEEIPAIKAVYSVARKVSERNGAAELRQVRQELSLAGYELDRSLVREVLAVRRDVHWLVDDWVWAEHGRGRNRLVNTSLRILSAHQPQTMTDMIGGVERAYSWRNSTSGASRRFALELPPEDVVEAFYRGHPLFSVDGDGMISSTETVDPEILRPEKLTLAGVLWQQPWP
jgi:hypothetical protein